MLWALNEERVKWRAAAGNIFVISIHPRRRCAEISRNIYRIVNHRACRTSDGCGIIALDRTRKPKTRMLAASGTGKWRSHGEKCPHTSRQSFSGHNKTEHANPKPGCRQLLALGECGQPYLWHTSRVIASRPPTQPETLKTPWLGRAPTHPPFVRSYPIHK
jgi:hypothetical protein